MRSGHFFPYRVVVAALLVVLAAACAGTPGSVSDTPATAEEIYRRTAASLPFVEARAGTGSGILIEDGWVVTNAHVVWPDEEVRLVFPDGTELTDVPVTSVDLIGDVALLGPVDIDAPGLELSDREDLVIGSDVFLVGYPLESDAFPEPTIVKGILSRIREWPAEDITFFQTDATAAPGQSGGILVDAFGRIVGVSGLSFGSQRFGMVAAGADISRRIETMQRRPASVPFRDRGLPQGQGSTSQKTRLANYWDEHVYLIYEPPGTSLEFEVFSDYDVGIGLYSLDGYEAGYADQGLSGTERISVVKEGTLPYYAQVFSFAEEEIPVSTSANVRLVPLTDADDGRAIVVGQTIYGNLDVIGDYDHFELELSRGELVEITVESVMIDPAVLIDRGEGWDVIGDDDSGGGILGLNSRAVFEAPVTGRYYVVVNDARAAGTGGYVLSVRETDDAAASQQFRPIPEDGATAGDAAQLGPAAVEESEESIAAWNRVFSMKPEGWVEDTAFFEQVAMLPGLRFGGGRPALTGYDPNVTVFTQPAPSNLTLAALESQLAQGVGSVGAEVRSAEMTTFAGRDALVADLDMTMALQRLTARQIYIIDGNEILILQAMATAGSAEMETALSVLESYRGFE